jgi:hypothetical protein
MSDEGLERFVQPFQQFGVTSVEALASSKHDDVYLRFNVGIEDANELARFKQLRARAAGRKIGSSGSSGGGLPSPFPSPTALERRAGSAPVSAPASAPARRGRRASTCGAEGVAMMQVWRLRV